MGGRGGERRYGGRRGDEEKKVLDLGGGGEMEAYLIKHFMTLRPTSPRHLVHAPQWMARVEVVRVRRARVIE